MSERDHTHRFDQLRRKAERLIDGQTGPAATNGNDITYLISELQIHQAELQVQNEELKLAQLKLSELHLQYEGLYEFAPCGYVTLGSNGMITRCNLTAAHMLGETRNMIMNRSFTQSVAPPWQQTFLAARQQSAECGAVQSVELMMQTKDQIPHWVTAKIDAHKNKDGEVLEWRVTLDTITERKQAETALRSSEERFRDLYENAPIPYQSLDKNGCLITVNQTWLTTLGYSKREVVGREFSQFLTPESKNQFDEKREYLELTGEVVNVECTMYKHDGTEIIALFHCKTSKDTSGETEKIHCVFHDITAERQFEEEKAKLEQKQRHVQKLESIATLAGGVAHDFNNMLTIMLGNCAEALELAGEAAPIIENLEDIYEAGLRAQSVVEQLLVFSRYYGFAAKPLAIDECVFDSLQDIRSTLPANISIKTQIDRDVHPVLGDAGLLKRVITDLCSNARDAMMTRGGILVISLENYRQAEKKVSPLQMVASGPHVKLTISDDGCGIGKTHLSHIFEPYYTTKEVGGGTGIGLAVVHGIIEQHQGVIDVESEVNKGTTVTIYIPACSESVETKRADKAGVPATRERILFIDDDPSLVKLCTRQLSGLGYRVEGTTDPTSALELLRRDPDRFDLVVTDVAMVGTAGVPLAKKISQVNPKVPIILSTGNPNDPAVVSISKSKKYSLIEKPHDIGTLSSLISNVLGDAQSRS